MNRKLYIADWHYDHENLGFTYDDLDRYIKTGTSGVSQIDEKIAMLHERNLHKLELMPTYTGVRL